MRCSEQIYISVVPQAMLTVGCFSGDNNLHLIDNFPVTEWMSENRGVEVPAVCRPGVFNYIRSCTEVHGH